MKRLNIFTAANTIYIPFSSVLFLTHEKINNTEMCAIKYKIITDFVIIS